MVAQLRIVHCFRSPVGGIFRHVRDLAEAQVAAGHLVGIICDSTTGGALEEKLFEDMRPMLALGVKRTPMQRHIGPGDVTAGWRTYRLIKELKPDVLHGHGAKGGVYARLFGSLLRVSRSSVARLYTAHGGSLHYDEATLTGRLFFALERLMERFTDRLLFVSDYERRAFERKVGRPRVPFDLIYNGLRDAEFEPIVPDAEAADFLYIGMMRDLKGPDLFIDALARTEMRLGRRVSAVMVGDGEDRQRYIAQVDRLGLADRVRFEMPMPARSAFPLARISVVPSRAEAMPYIVLETLAAGMPMIATAVGGIPEVFSQGSPALVRPDVEEISEAMTRALGDPEAFALAMPSAEELRSRFSAAVMAADIEKAYWAALKPKS
ncbi:MAG: glycosyltransferase family 4 protein [Rhizobiaceae bacterium]